MNRHLECGENLAWGFIQWQFLKVYFCRLLKPGRQQRIE